MLDLYEVLGVPEDATPEEIRRAYRAAARREHPDVSGRPDAAERMQSLNDAFAVLGDEKTRDAYDHGRIPPGGWGDERDPWEPSPPRPRRRRAIRLLAVLLLALAIAAAAAVAVNVMAAEQQVDGHLPRTAAAVEPLEESFDEAPPPEPSAPSGGLRAFVADAEGCALWQEFDDNVARPVETLRGAVLLARAGPENAAARRKAVRRMAPLMSGAADAFDDIVVLVGFQEEARGTALPWRGVGAELERASEVLSQRYDQFADSGKMPRAAPAPVVRALQAVQRADELHERLASVCAPALSAS